MPSSHHDLREGDDARVPSSVAAVYDVYDRRYFVDSRKKPALTERRYSNEADDYRRGCSIGMVDKHSEINLGVMIPS